MSGFDGCYGVASLYKCTKILYINICYHTHVIINNKRFVSQFTKKKKADYDFSLSAQWQNITTFQQ